MGCRWVVGKPDMAKLVGSFAHCACLLYRTPLYWTGYPDSRGMLHIPVSVVLGVVSLDPFDVVDHVEASLWLMFCYKYPPFRVIPIN